MDVVWATRSDALLRGGDAEEGTLPVAVCICDDHPAFARGLVALLADEAPDLHVVGVALSGEQAETFVRDTPPDVVLMDIRMPGIGGIEATRRIRASSPSTRVIVLTASDEQADLYDALRAGASGYVLKESEIGEIASVIRSVVRGQLVIPASLVGDFVRDLETADAALTAGEWDILAAIGRGETNREIGARLGYSERTVRRRVEDIYSKLHLSDRLHAAVYAAERGLNRSGGGR